MWITLYLSTGYPQFFGQSCINRIYIGVNWPKIDFMIYGLFFCPQGQKMNNEPRPRSWTNLDEGFPFMVREEVVNFIFGHIV